MIVIALDCSKTSTGFAVTDGRAWQTGALRCPIQPPKDMRRGDIDAGYSGAVCDWFRIQLHALLEEHRPQHAAIEKPMPGNIEKKEFYIEESDMVGKSLKSRKVGNTQVSTLHFLHGVVFEASGLLFRRRIPAIFVPVVTWRSSVGIGRPPKTVKDKRGWYKAQAMEQCRLRGILVKNNDAAEAACMAVHLLGILNLQARIGQLL